MEILKFISLFFLLINIRTMESDKLMIEYHYNLDSAVKEEYYYLFNGKLVHLQKMKFDMEKIEIYDFSSNNLSTYLKSNFGWVKNTSKPDFTIPHTETLKIDYEMMIEKGKQKNILGYNCYQVKISDLSRDIRYNLFVTESLNDFRVTHWLKKRYPDLPGVPLEFAWDTKVCTATDITSDFNESHIELPNPSEYQQLTESKINKIFSFSQNTFY
jgi:hypothetical protein